MTLEHLCRAQPTSSLCYCFPVKMESKRHCLSLTTVWTTEKPGFLPFNSSCAVLAKAFMGMADLGKSSFCSTSFSRLHTERQLCQAELPTRISANCRVHTGAPEASHLSWSRTEDKPSSLTFTVLGQCVTNPISAQGRKCSQYKDLFEYLLPRELPKTSLLYTV